MLEARVAHAREHAEPSRSGITRSSTIAVDAAPRGRSAAATAASPPSAMTARSRSGAPCPRAGGAARDRRRRSGSFGHTDSRTRHTVPNWRRTVAGGGLNGLLSRRDRGVNVAGVGMDSAAGCRSDLLHRRTTLICTTAIPTCRFTSATDRHHACTPATLPAATSPLRNPGSARCRNGTSPTSIRDRRSPRSTRDLERADAESVAFEEAYKGKLADARRAPDGGGKLAEAVKRYEALDDLLGRLISYAGLVYAGDTTDPVRAKFYGDMQERITAASTASAVLHARAQPHRRRRARSARCGIPRSAITGRGSRTCARRSRTSSRTASRSCSTRSR